MPRALTASALAAALTGCAVLAVAAPPVVWVGGQPPATEAAEATRAGLGALGFGRQGTASDETLRPLAQVAADPADSAQGPTGAPLAFDLAALGRAEGLSPRLAGCCSAPMLTPSITGARGNPGAWADSGLALLPGADAGLPADDPTGSATQPPPARSWSFEYQASAPAEASGLARETHWLAGVAGEAGGTHWFDHSWRWLMWLGTLALGGLPADLPTGAVGTPGAEGQHPLRRLLAALVPEPLTIALALGVLLLLDALRWVLQRRG